MTLVERLLEEIPGAEKVIQLLAEQLSDLHIPEGPKIRGLSLCGTEDLELSCEVAPPAERYRNSPYVNYQWPHLIIQATTGLIQGVRGSAGYFSDSTILETTASRALVKIVSSASEGVNIGRPGPRQYEAIVEIRYASGSGKN